MQDNVRYEHEQYQAKMKAWFREQEAIIASDLLDLEHARKSASLFKEKARLYDIQAQSNIEQHAADKNAYDSAKANFDEYMSGFTKNQEDGTETNDTAAS